MESVPLARKHPEADISRTALWRGLPPLLAVVLGLWGLERGPGGGSMWRDESVTVEVAHRPLAGLLDLLWHVDAVHGLYYLLMHGVYGLWDGGLWALRLPSVAATALAAAGVAAVADRLAGPRAALIAGSAYALLPPVQMYAQEGRSYALVACAVVWATYLMLAERWVAYAVVLLLGCWLHEFAVLALPAHGCAARRSRGWRSSAVAVVAALLPLAVVSARQARQQLGWLGRPSWQDWAAYGVLAVAVVLLARGVREERRALRVAVPLALLPPGLLMTLSLVHPWYVDRYVLYALVGFALLIGLRLARVEGVRARAVWPWVLAGALLAPWGWWSLWLRTPESRKDDALAVAAAVRERARPGDGVVFLPARRREWLLSSPDTYAPLRDLALAETPEASHSLWGSESTPGRIRARLAGATRVVALLDPPDQPLDPYPAEVAKREALADGFRLCSVTDVRGARIAVFARTGADCR
ncbi:glycosyltransferase family 39 protein [Streptomyces sp. A1136]|uniref:glycosyltransferase family 39 protein n=1 Tax=Streptomyces sp. A1136 TaxID=2563102 RepID=UPI001445FEDE|nr:glycosyltransferase family 39 protein [Streptomyces sp. A1136]